MNLLTHSCHSSQSEEHTRDAPGPRGPDWKDRGSSEQYLSRGFAFTINPQKETASHRNGRNLQVPKRVPVLILSSRLSRSALIHAVLCSNPSEGLPDCQF